MSRINAFIRDPTMLSSCHVKTQEGLTPKRVLTQPGCHPDVGLPPELWKINKPAKNKIPAYGILLEQPKSSPKTLYQNFITIDEGLFFNMWGFIFSLWLPLPFLWKTNWNRNLTIWHKCDTCWPPSLLIQVKEIDAGCMNWSSK